MIKFECNKGKTSIKVGGTIKEITADTCVFVMSMYNALKEENEYCAEFFKHIVCNELGELVFCDEAQEANEKDLKVMSEKKSKSKDDKVEEEKEEKEEEPNIEELIEEFADVLRNLLSDD